jgi:hypothetical protein
MLSKGISFEDWSIVKDDFIDIKTPVTEERLKIYVDNLELYEDMFQATFGDLCLDIGWYGETFQDGRFIVFLIKNQDWDSPLDKFETRSVTEVIEKVKTLVWLPL